MLQCLMHHFIVGNNRNPLNLSARFFRVGINKTFRNVGRCAIAEQFFRQTDSDLSGSDDCDTDLICLFVIVKLNTVSRKHPDNDIQNPSQHGISVAAFVRIAIYHTDCQRTQQRQAADAQHSCKRDVSDRQELFNEIIQQECTAVGNEQSYVALYSAVSPHLTVYLPKPTHKENTRCRCYALHNDIHRLQSFHAPVQDE